LRLKLPATSANLGPGFDAAGLAMSMYLTLEARPAAAWSIDATGRDAAVCGRVEDSLVLETYRGVMQRSGLEPLPLAIKLHNEIPLGMGCGSSAAALLAGVALANHVGALKLGGPGIVEEASRLEGHPDNVAACWHGGFTVSSQADDAVELATFAGAPSWRILLAVQAASFATKKARALLPETYSKADAIFNVQRTAMLVAAFAQGRLELLRSAMQDRLHQPYRAGACPLLGMLLPLAQEADFAGVALSGAGPSVLMFLEQETLMEQAKERVCEVVGDGVELMELEIAPGAEMTLL
jgi:homoserine kinase